MVRTRNREEEIKNMVVPKSQGESQETGKRPTVETAAKRPDERSERFYWIWQFGDDSVSWSLVLGQ